MPDITFQKCMCGIHFKIMRRLDNRSQVFSCECGRDNEVTGTILNVHFTKSSPTPDPRWIRLPLWNIRDGK